MQETSENNQRHSRIRYTLVFSILLFIYCVALGCLVYFISWDEIKEVNFKEHFRLYKESFSKSDITSFDCYLYNINGLTICSREIEINDSDNLHLMLEALLLPLSESEISSGFISYIPQKTQLVGATYSLGSIFVELSNNLLESSDIGKAIEQIEATVNSSLNPIDITIIVDGNKIN